MRISDWSSDVCSSDLFAKLRFTGRDAIFRMLVAALVVPGQIGMLPLFLELKAMGLVNSYAGALVPWLAGIFGIFLVRQYCRSEERSVGQEWVSTCRSGG